MDTIKIIRTGSEGNATFGKLFVNGQQIGVTLENYSKKIHAGTYPAEFYNSPQFGRVILLKNVVGRTYIEIHAGNYATDTKGCILVGSRKVKQEIWNSKSTLSRLIGLLENSQSFQVTVE